ncbi:MAG TPA: TonB family protein [Pyrinomonadaceae bacterium]|nr:TonB family protein [Pyrinomonadaceae bacterium]
MSKRLLHRTLLHAAALACLISLAVVARAQQQPAAERGAALAKAEAEALRVAVKRDKRNADAWHMLGAALARAGDGKGSRKAFETALKLRPDHAPSRAGLAHALLLLGKPTDAEREAARAFAADPQSAEAVYVLGVARRTRADFKSAAEAAESALRLDPNFAPAARLMGEALLDSYADAGERYRAQYSSAPEGVRLAREESSEDFRRAVAPLKARMLETADKLDAFVKARPDLQNEPVLLDVIDTLRFYGRLSRDGLGDLSGVFPWDKVTTKAVILFKPEPAFTEEARKNNVSGVVRLRAVLGADGRVRNILVLKRLPDGLTDKAVAVARRIRFQPATLDGRPVSQMVVLEYNFNVY